MLKVALIGSTGAVGQEFVIALNKHPWFELTCIASSERSAGKKYVDALRDPNSGILRWHNKEQIPEYIHDMIVSKVEEIDAKKFDLVFTALESDDAKIIEPKFAQSVPVISTAAAFRYENDVPILIPGINDNHIELLNVQRKNRGWNGFISPLPNCHYDWFSNYSTPNLECIWNRRCFHDIYAGIVRCWKISWCYCS